MVEILGKYNEQGKEIGKGPKKEVLKEQREYSFEHGDSPFAVEASFLLLTHPEKGLYLIKRANKGENPYMWCKSVGGHISYGDNPDETMIREAQEEIQVKVILAESNAHYIDLLSNDQLVEHAIINKIGYIPWLGTYRVDRDARKEMKPNFVWKKRWMAHVYAGVFRGEVGFIEAIGDDFEDGLGETVDHMFMKKEKLKSILESGDPRFTHDLGVLVKEYYDFI